MADILIVVGTESGNAEMVAEYLRDELAGLGHGIDIFSDGDAASQQD